MLTWSLLQYIQLLAKIKCLPFISPTLGIPMSLEHSLNIIKCQKWSKHSYQNKRILRECTLASKHIYVQIKITTNQQGELCHFILRSNLKFTKIGQKELLTIANSLYRIVTVDGECQRTMGRERKRLYDPLSKEDLSGFRAHLYTYKKMVVSCTSFWLKRGCLDQAAKEIVPLSVGIFLGFRICCNSNNTPHRACNFFCNSCGFGWIRLA